MLRNCHFVFNEAPGQVLERKEVHIPRTREAAETYSEELDLYRSWMDLTFLDEDDMDFV